MALGFFSKKLSAKLLLVTMAFVLLVELLIFIPSAALFRQTWLEDRAQDARLVTLAIAGLSDFNSSPALEEEFMTRSSAMSVAERRDGMTRLVLGMPPMVGSRVEVEDIRQTRRLPRFRKAFNSFFGADDGFIRILADSADPDVQVIEVVVPEKAVKTAMHHYFQRVLYWSLFIALLTGLMVYAALSWIIVRPLQKLAGGLKSFRQDPQRIRGGTQTNPRRRDEIGQLEMEFVDMKKDVRSAFKQRERLADLGMAVAKNNHDLRNVLASAQLVSERLANDEEPRIKKMGQRLLRAVDRGTKLTSATLSFAKTTEDKAVLKRRRIAQLIGEAAADAIGEADVDFENTVPSQLNVQIDPEHTYRILQNVMRNAVAALSGQVDARLSVSCQDMDGKTCIEIADNGPGLPDVAKDNLFQAFKSSAAAGGTGLGLTIARELARGQGGDLRLIETGPEGTKFGLSVISAPSKTGHTSMMIG